jgi:hypothetical protein
MDELAGYVVGLILIAVIVGTVIAIGLSIGVFLLGGIALVGLAAGFGVAARNFFSVLIEAHRTVPR